MEESPPSSARGAAYDAVIFDMDGVVTDTARLHAQAWKTLFDETLSRLTPGPVAPFDPDKDYRQYVDGRPREDGIRTFLLSRGIVLAADAAEHASAPGQAGPDAVTISSLAQRKQAVFDGLLESGGVQVIPGTVALLRLLREHGVLTGVVSSSRNCRRVLEAASVAELFDVRVDGADAALLHLAGKPAPDLFLEAARRLRVLPSHAVVVEDATAGVRAAAAGGFGLIVGLDRTGHGDGLRTAGAHQVVADLAELGARGLELGEVSPSARPTDTALDPPAHSPADDPWLLRFDGFDPATEGTREALCTLGNGYWGTRGAAAESDADSVHYPGTYLAGVYNRLRTPLGDRSIDMEEMVNAPNWLSLTFKVADGEWFRPESARLLTYRQELDLRRGVLTRIVRFLDSSGRTTRVTTRRFVSQSNPHVAVLDTTFTAEDWSGALTVRSAIEGRVANTNVAASRLCASQHLVPRRTSEISADAVLLEMETTQSGVHIALAARTRVYDGNAPIDPPRQFLVDTAGWVAQEFDVSLTRGAAVRVEKVVAVSTSRDRAILSPAAAVTTSIARMADAAALLSAHEREWQIIWEQFAVELNATEHVSLALNLNVFHVLQTVAAVDTDLDAGVPARGLHGEGYQGHVFWDELFVYPMLTLRRPDLSRALLGYRYRRLDEARAAARAAGCDGAIFPWQSGIDGSDVTPVRLFNPRNEQWMPDHSHLQRHVGLALAYSIWQYYQTTGDAEFLLHQGAEMVVEIARYFASLAAYDSSADRYDIAGVMGPDEFHDGYPGAAGLGVRNNAYSNVMTAWVLLRAVETVALLEGRYSRQLWNRLRLRPGEVARWERISTRLRVPFHPDGVISQFEGYEALREIDLADYRQRYGSIGRLDLILQAEGDSTNNYRVSKQPDVLMLLYLFSAEELRELLEKMGYAYPAEAVVRTVEFYGARSVHGSTLSNVVHSWLAARRDREGSWSFLTKALDSDLSDIQGGTTHEGIHLGALAGSVDMLVRCYTGLEFRGDTLWFHPVLPAELDGIAFTIIYREQLIRVELSTTTLRLGLRAGGTVPISVRVEGRKAVLTPGETRDFVVGTAADTDGGASAP